MTAFPSFLRLIKGSPIGLDTVNPMVSGVVSQHAPDTLSHAL